MNDHERFSAQMDQTLEVLHDTIGNVNVPLAQTDKLSGLVRSLRESAYQAGRAEMRNEAAKMGD